VDQLLQRLEGICSIKIKSNPVSWTLADSQISHQK